MIGYQSCVYTCACVMHVLIGNNFDISISTNTRRTEGFDILVFVLVLMSRLSSLVHKHLVLVLVFVLVSLVGTRLNKDSSKRYLSLSFDLDFSVFTINF